MIRHRQLQGAATALALAITIAAFGCGKKTIINPVPNERPTVTLTAAPVNTQDTAYYAYRIDWSGNDPDGRIDHYTYAVDPPAKANADTAWVTTTKNEEVVFFRSTTPLLGGPKSKATDLHNFVLKAWDNGGLASAPVNRWFYSYTIAPVVQITAPTPSNLLIRKVTPSMTVNWQGKDEDGVYSQKPVKYKFILLPRGNPDIDIDFAMSIAGPDSLRRLYAKNNFATWDSVGGDTTTVHFTNLTPGLDYLFVLIGYDEDGAYSPDFSLVGNMLALTVTNASSNGPALTVFNQFVFYATQTGSFAPANPTTWVNVEIPASQSVTFNWIPSATWVSNNPGVSIVWYRWRIDGDVDDETPRTNENTDWYHWSQPSVGTTSCTIGPFATSIDHKLYIEAQDNNGLTSVLTVHFTPVIPTFNLPLLVVDDTRLEVDQVSSNKTLAPNGVLAYSKAWPSRAELDTFLFAHGGVPWQGTQQAGTPPLSPPGILSGYAWDSLGSRQGFEIASNGVPFSKLGQYKHVIWMVDHYGGVNTLSPASASLPQSTLRWMSTPGNPNTLSTYAFAGGEVWMFGGDAAYASLKAFNATGANNNDNIYGPGKTVFSNSKNELIPGRIMYDGAHWQNEMVVQATPITIVRSVGTNKAAWVQPGYQFVGTHQMTPADYALLPAQLRPKAAALGDALPPTRTASQSGTFYLTSSQDVEYISQPNWILEDIDPSPIYDNEQPTLDTLYALQGGTLVTGRTLEAASMTWYHGPYAPQFIFSGFAVWYASRVDVQAVFDFVLQKIWGFPAPAGPRTVMLAAHPTNAKTGISPSAPTPAAVRSRVPGVRSGAR